jgi:hypothetical protein
VFNAILISLMSRLIHSLGARNSSVAFHLSSCDATMARDMDNHLVDGIDESRIDCLPFNLHGLTLIDSLICAVDNFSRGIQL